MTVDEKREALRKYCEQQVMCANCALYTTDCSVDSPWEDFADEKINEWYARCYGDDTDEQLTIFDAPDPTVGGEPKPDVVNHPSHYTSGKIEVVDFIFDQQLDYPLGCALKYICRCGKKSSAGMTIEEKAKQDLKKAIRYLELEIEHLEGKR